MQRDSIQIRFKKQAKLLNVVMFLFVALLNLMNTFVE